MPVAETFVRAGTLYLIAGTIFAVWFAARGAGRLDPVATHGSWGFRLLVIPGAALLWPYLLYRVLRRGPAPPEENTPHRAAAKARAGRP